MARTKLYLSGACCFVFLVLIFSSTQLGSSHLYDDLKRAANSPWTKNQKCLGESSCVPEASKLAETAPTVSVQASSRTTLASTKATQAPTKASKASKSPTKATLTAHSPNEKALSKMAQAASDSAMKLQYALDSMEDSLEDPHLFSMGRYVSTFTAYLKAILAEPSIERKTFHQLRQQFFPWWFPSAKTTYLPWESQDNPRAGIVMTVGKGNYVLASHCIQTLRKVVNSTLPIQIFYAGDDDLPELYRQEIKGLHPSIETTDILDHFNETTAVIHGSGYAMKPFAALASRFERVILVDADTIFLRRPDFDFEENNALNKTGLYYFHDRAYAGARTTDWIKELLRGTPPSKTLNGSLFWQKELEHQQESGVVFINKAVPAAFMSILFSTYMNTQKVRNFVGGHVSGDKETFWLASELSSAPYAFVPTYAGIIGDYSDDGESMSSDSKKMCSAQPFHLDHNGRPFWFNSGLRLEKVIDSREYVSLVHYLPGSSSTVDEDFSWQFRSHHTFCVEAETQLWRTLDRSEKAVANAAVAEAKKMDMRFLGHEGGEHNDPEGQFQEEEHKEEDTEQQGEEQLGEDSQQQDELQSEYLQAEEPQEEGQQGEDNQES
ncbi:MAG: hypothetical protein Q9195_004508 [Heterodermia aff. obscurata]